MSHDSKYASPEQLRYAAVLAAGIRAGFALLVLTFLIYMLGILKPSIPVEELPRYWGMPLAEFVRATGTSTGWGWVARIGQGDVLNLTGVVVLAGTPALSCLAVLPTFARRGEIALLAIASLQIVVVIVAASNVLAALK